MPFDPAQFVFQPRPLQNFDIGAGFRDLADARMKDRQLAENKRQSQASLGELQAQRQDTNSLNSAKFAKDRVDSQFEAETAKRTKRAQIAESIRQALQANDTAAAEALGPGLIALGGTFRKEEAPNGDVNYVTEEGDAPTRGPLDVQGARSEIFGGGSSSGPARQSQPFSMPGLGQQPPASPLLSTGSPFGPRDNPFESLPGASAAALPQPPAPPAPDLAGPPPGAAVDGVEPPVAPAPQPPPGSAEADLAAMGEMGADTTEDSGPAPDDELAADEEEPAPDDAEEASAAPAAPAAPSDPDLSSLDPVSAAMVARINEQLGPQSPEAPAAPAAPARPRAGAAPAPQNPYNPPAFSPYRISMSDVMERNRAQNQPLQQALEEGSPAGFRGRAEAFNRNVNRAGMSPDRTKALAGPLLDKLTDMYRTETGAELAGQRMANTRDRQGEIAAQRSSDAFFKRKQAAFNNIMKTSALADVKTLNVKQRAAKDVDDLVKLAGTNGQAAYQLIGKMHDLADKGIMTKDDYSEATQGQVAWATAFLRGAERKLIQEKGLDPDSIDDIIAVAKAMSKRLRQETYGAMDKAYSQYKGTKNAAERAGIAQAMRGVFDAEYLPEDVAADDSGPDEPESYKPTPRGASSVAPSGDNLGKVPLPDTLDGKPAGRSASGTEYTRGSKVPPKPPKKKPANEVDDLLR